MFTRGRGEEGLICFTAGCVSVSLRGEGISRAGWQRDAGTAQPTAPVLQQGEISLRSCLSHLQDGNEARVQKQ